MAAPLVTIFFEWSDWRRAYSIQDPTIRVETLRPDKIIVRHWYRVPRVGEKVDLREDDEDFGGSVRQVWWDDDGNVKVSIA